MCVCGERGVKDRHGQTTSQSAAVAAGFCPNLGAARQTSQSSVKLCALDWLEQNPAAMPGLYWQERTFVTFVTFATFVTFGGLPLCLWQVTDTTYGQSAGFMTTPAIWAQVTWKEVAQFSYEHWMQAPRFWLAFFPWQNTHFCNERKNTKTSGWWFGLDTNPPWPHYLIFSFLDFSFMDVQR